MSPGRAARGRQRRHRLIGGVVLLLLIGLGVGIGAMLVTRMPGESHRGPLPPLSAEQQALAERLRGHVTELAGAIGERNVWQPGTLDAAARYIAAALAESGRPVRHERFDSRGQQVQNLYVEHPGAADGGALLVVGAHYDTVPGSPGANDNASGVAALLELARLLPGLESAAPLRLVAFVNEEAPFFSTGEMGSMLHARTLAQEQSRGESEGESGRRLGAMLSLETMGYYSDRPGSQHYPPPLGMLYPDRGDFIAFVGNFGSRQLVRRAVRAFREHAAFPAEGLAAPRSIPGVAWSDHASFWAEGWPALMVTDTAPYRYPHYHSATDTPEKVDYERLARVVDGLARALPAMRGGP